MLNLLICLLYSSFNHSWEVFDELYVIMNLHLSPAMWPVSLSFPLCHYFLQILRKGRMMFVAGCRTEHTAVVD